MAHVRSYQLGPHSALSQKILNELAAARTCLLNAERKAVYDEQLRRKTAPSQLSEGPPVHAHASAVDRGPDVSAVGRRRQLTLGRRRFWRASLAVAAGAAVLVAIALLLWPGGKRRVASTVPSQSTAAQPKREKSGELGGVVQSVPRTPGGRGAGDKAVAVDVGQEHALPSTGEKPVDGSGRPPLAPLASNGKQAGGEGPASAMSQHPALQPRDEEPADLGGRPSVPNPTHRGKRKAGAAASATSPKSSPPRPLAMQPSSPVPLKPPHPSPTWRTTGEYPVISGIWREGTGAQVAITQRQGSFTATCAYHHPKFGEIRWKMSGTIFKGGRLSGTLTHTLYPRNVGWTVVQERAGKLDVDGTTIHGHFTSDGGGHKFVWTLERRLPAE